MSMVKRDVIKISHIVTNSTLKHKQKPGFKPGPSKSIYSGN